MVQVGPRERCREEVVGKETERSAGPQTPEGTYAQPRAGSFSCRYWGATEGFKWERDRR